MKGSPKYRFGLLLSKLSFVCLSILLCTSSCLFGQKLKFGNSIYPLIKKQDWTAAKPLLHRLLEQHPSHSKANFWLAKIYEQEGMELLSAAHIQKSASYYLRCKSNFTKDQLNIFNQHHYPELTYFRSSDRLESFKAYLASHANEIRFIAREMNVENRTQCFQSMQEVEEQLQIKLPESVASIPITNFELSYDWVGYQGRGKIHGKMSIDTHSIADLLSVYWQADVVDNEIQEKDSLFVRPIKRVKKELQNVNIEGLEDMLHVPIYPFVSTLFDYYDGYLHYVIVDTNVYLDGPFYFELQGKVGQPIYGLLSEQSGFVDIINHQWDSYDEVGFRLYIVDGRLQCLDYEKIVYHQSYYSAGSYEGELVHMAAILRNNETRQIRDDLLISSEIGSYQLVSSNIEKTLTAYRPTAILFTDRFSKTHSVLSNQIEPEIKKVLIERPPLKEWLELELERRRFETNILPRKVFNRIKSIRWE